MSMKMLISTQWLYNETSSSVLVGMLGLAQLFQMPVVLFGGVMADSSDRKKLMIYTQLVSFVMLFALAIFAQVGALAPWHVFGVIAVTGITSMLGSSNILGMHWGTIRLSAEDPWDPPKKFYNAAKQMGYKENQIWKLPIGGTKSIL